MIFSTQPFLTGMEVVSIIAGLVLVVVIGEIHAYSPDQSKTTSLIALIFISMFAVLTCTNHFLYLTVLNKVTFESSNLNSILSLGNWPSLVMAVDYLAWGLFLGLALLFAAASFKGDRLRSALRWTFVFSGTLCILGVVGVALIDPLLWFVSVTGYGLGFPIISILLTMLYIKSKWLSS